MKAVFLIVLFFLSAQALTLTLNSTAYHLGFTDQLGLDANQLSDASYCISGVHKIVQDIHRVIDSKIKNLTELQQTLAFGFLVADAKSKLKLECAAYRADLIGLIAKESANTNILEVIQKNMKKYAIQLIQEVATWAGQYAHREDYEAGKTEAYIFQILTGIETPKTVAKPQWNFTEAVAFDESRFYTEFYQGYLTALGLTNQTEVDIIAKCGIAYVKALDDLTFLKLKLDLETLDTVTNTVKLLMAASDSCTGAWKIGGPYLMRSLNSIKVGPVLMQLVYNIAANLPELQQKEAIVANDVFKGEYEQAGFVHGNVLRTVLQNVTYF